MKITDGWHANSCWFEAKKIFFFLSCLRQKSADLFAFREAHGDLKFLQKKNNFSRLRACEFSKKNVA